MLSQIHVSVLQDGLDTPVQLVSYHLLKLHLITVIARICLQLCVVPGVGMAERVFVHPLVIALQGGMVHPVKQVLTKRTRLKLYTSSFPYVSYSLQTRFLWAQLCNEMYVSEWCIV